MLDRRLIRNFDVTLVLLVLVICAIGMVTLYSATHGMSEVADPYHYVKRQAIFLGLGIACMLAICFSDYINLTNWVRYLYVANLALLILVLILGTETKGSMRWISIGFFDLQPSEIAKVIVIITLAKLLADREGRFERFSNVMPAILATALPMLLVFFQPDLGTSLVFIAVLMGMLYLAGVRARYLLYMVAAGAVVAPLLWFSFLQEYQKMRLMVFVDPAMDPIHYGYQIIQSMISIGSGGLLGKGFCESSQSRLQFLPEFHTDFIFSLFGEEFGFIGAIVLILLYFLLIYRILWIGTHSKDRFGSLICWGVAIMFFFQVLVNVGMTISIMPVTGLPLPFMSYGNNALLVNIIAIGLVLNVGMRRHKIQF